MKHLPPDETVLRWHEWNPGLDNGHLILGDVVSTMHAAGSSPQDSVPWWVRLIENPTSPLALPGAVPLFEHDCIHVLLGRGMAVQDEAFVIGYTMGAASATRKWHLDLYRLAAWHLYRKPWRFAPHERISFDLGAAEGQIQPATDLHLFPFRDHLDKSIDEMRAMLGVQRKRLYAVYAHEQILLPDTKASRRLDVRPAGVDPSDIRPPDGPPSDWIKEKI